MFAERGLPRAARYPVGVCKERNTSRSKTPRKGLLREELAKAVPRAARYPVGFAEKGISKRSKSLSFGG